jgi:hypothetical protein
MASNASSPDRIALDKVAGWAQAEPGVSISADGSLVVAGGTPLALTVTADDERVQLTHRHLESLADQSRVESVRRNLPGRGSAVTGVVTSAGTTMEAILTATIYIDGLTRQGFVAAFNELVSAADRAFGTVPSAASASTPAAPVAAVTTPESAPAAATVTAEVEPATPVVVADTAPTMILTQVWVPTHRVPEGGMRAWPKPDPAVEPIATLQARVELSIAESKGDWARVVGSNGWTGWVDARRLLPMAAARPQAAAASSGGGFPVGALGAVALIAAAFLPWFKTGAFEADSFDIALPFLWDLAATGEPALGYGIAGLGVLGLLALFVKGVPDAVRRLAGIAGMAASAVFAYQVHRGLDGTVSDTMDVLGYGVYVALAGALVLLLAPSAKRAG